MTETPNILMQFFALITATGMFAGLWVSDIPPDRPILPLVQVESRPAEVDTADNWVAVKTQVTAVEIDEDRWQAAESFSGQTAVAEPSPVKAAPPIERTRTLDAEGMSLSPAALQRHIDLLPKALPSGDYRMIDSYGGVGWLLIRSDEPEQETEVEDGVWTTFQDGTSIRFIRVERQPDGVA